MLHFIATLVPMLGAQDRPSPEGLPLREAPKNLGNILTMPRPANAGNAALPVILRGSRINQSVP